MKISFHSGFTLIELLVVISIIGLLSSVVLSSLNSARSGARDARRQADLAEARKALQLYYHEYGNFATSCASSGNGWFNYDYTANNSMADCLTEFTGSEITDPTGGVTSSPTSGYTYMKYTCPSGTFLYAKLETESQSSSATDGTCCAGCDTSHGMNYVLKVD